MPQCGNELAQNWPPAQQPVGHEVLLHTQPLRTLQIDPLGQAGPVRHVHAPPMQLSANEPQLMQAAPLLPHAAAERLVVRHVFP